MRAIAVRQAQLEEANKTMERKIAGRTEELARSNADLAQFANAASHDLKEPLRKVASFSDLLAQRFRGRLDPDADKLISRIVDGATRMMALIDSILLYSKVGSETNSAEPVDLSAACRRIVDDLELPIRDNGAVVTCGHLPSVVAVPSQIAQLFQNLIGNALKFHGKEAPRVRISARRDGREWLFQVEDNGIGIDPKNTGQLFVMFRRLHSRAEYPGTGMGLAICKRIVERHGGRIWIESKPGEGSRFCFTLPAVLEEKSNGAPRVQLSAR
jgi:light-regulated signal transduction histidine kinase (bacteriophytochrome)